MADTAGLLSRGASKEEAGEEKGNEATKEIANAGQRKAIDAAGMGGSETGDAGGAKRLWPESEAFETAQQRRKAAVKPGEAGLIGVYWIIRCLLTNRTLRRVVVRQKKALKVCLFVV